MRSALDAAPTYFFWTEVVGSMLRSILSCLLSVPSRTAPCPSRVPALIRLPPPSLSPPPCPRTQHSQQLHCCTSPASLLLPSSTPDLLLSLQQTVRWLPILSNRDLESVDLLYAYAFLNSVDLVSTFLCMLSSVLLHLIPLFRSRLIITPAAPPQTNSDPIPTNQRAEEAIYSVC